MKKILFFTFVIMVAMGAGKSFAYTVPEDDTNVEFMYVTGPKGDPLRGADDHTLTLNIDVPEDEEGAVKIGIYDPGTGGEVDARIDGTNSWDTKTVMTLSGKNGEISKKKFTDDDNYDSKFYYFDSLSKTDGKKVGSYYRFTLEITAVSGDDANLFKADISPASVKVSSPNITFRLVDEEGTAMHFYPLVPAGVDQIIVSNYDLDHDGGVSSIHDNNQDYELEDSTSGQWHDTVVNLSSTKERYLDYKIIKGTQFWAHAGIRITDKDGNPIPIYFRKKNMGGCDEFTFDATSSFDPDNQALVYHWEFGDGTVSEEPIVTHRFPKGGEYNVILSVQDNSGLECDTAVSSQVVSVNTPPVADFTGPGIACTEQTVTFDASGSTDNTPGQLSYLWSFGDGTSAEGKQVTKVFNKGGTYNVSLDVNDNSDTICNADNARSTIIINTKPVASAGDDIDLCLPHNEEYSVNFNGSDSRDADGNDLNYRWDFGDGSNGSGSNITHVYQNRGEYVATLFIDDGSASACSSDSDSLNVKLNKAPVAIAGPDIAVCQGTAITFDGSNSIGEEGEQLQYDWDFGDGTTERGVTVVHTYESGGAYKAVLTVNDMQLTRCSTSIEKVFVTVNSNPTATINAVNLAVTGDEITFDGSGSNDPDSDGLSYTWDFGDGQGGQSGASASHAYAQGGTYSVALTVDDNKGTECSKDLTTMNVTINTPPAAVINAVDVACAGGEVSFDGSGSSDADGDSLTYTWDFGDGSEKQSGPNVTHVYAKGGNYTVSLVVDDNKGTTRSGDVATTNISINTPPSAVFDNVSLACTGDDVSFDASGSTDVDGDSLTYTWDFGDGSGSESGSYVTHVYNKGGSYSVKLSIDDNKGTVCSSDLTDSNIRINTPPVADAGPNHVCCLDAVSDFDGSGSFDADGDSLSYSWDFGDGNTGEGAKVNHVYSKQGTYTVTLTVNDNSGTKCDSSSDSFTAVVNAKPTSIIKVR